MEKNKIMMVAIIILLVAVIGAVVGVGLMVVRSLGKEDVDAEGSLEYKGVSHLELELVGIDGPISTNLLTGEDRVPHTVRLDLSISVVNSEETLEESTELIALLQNKKVVIKSIVLDYVKKKTYEEIMKTDAKEKLENEIKEKLQIEFETNLIYSVEIFEFIAI